MNHMSFPNNYLSESISNNVSNAYQNVLNFSREWGSYLVTSGYQHSKDAFNYSVDLIQNVAHPAFKKVGEFCILATKDENSEVVSSLLAAATFVPVLVQGVKMTGGLFYGKWIWVDTRFKSKEELKAKLVSLSELAKKLPAAPPIPTIPTIPSIPSIASQVGVLQAQAQLTQAQAASNTAQIEFGRLQGNSEQARINAANYDNALRGHHEALKRATTARNQLAKDLDLDNENLFNAEGNEVQNAQDKVNQTQLLLKQADAEVNQLQINFNEAQAIADRQQNEVIVATNRLNEAGVARDLANRLEAQARNALAQANGQVNPIPAVPIVAVAQGKATVPAKPSDDNEGNYFFNLSIEKSKIKEGETHINLPLSLNQSLVINHKEMKNSFLRASGGVILIALSTLGITENLSSFIDAINYEDSSWLSNNLLAPNFVKPAKYIGKPIKWIIHYSLKGIGEVADTSIGRLGIAFGLMSGGYYSLKSTEFAWFDYKWNAKRKFIWQTATKDIFKVFTGATLITAGIFSVNDLFSTK